jgi:hypothetical protein
MDNRLLLVKSLTLLYRESQLPDTDSNAKELVRTVLEGIQLSDINLSVNHERDILQTLKQTILEMCNNPEDHVYEVVELMQRIKMNTGLDEKLYESFVQGIEPELSEASLKRTVNNIKKSLNNHFREQKISEILTKAANQFKYQREKIKNTNQFVAEVVGQLDPFQLDHSTKDPAIISDIDTSNLKDVGQVFTSIKEAATGVSKLKTGWQGVNRMLGGGFGRGEQWVIGALQHQFKTGFSLTLFKHLAIYNTPKMKDITKKPLLLRISAEDPIKYNFQALYQSLKENETGQTPNIHALKEEEIADYVQKKLAVNGYHTRFMHINPSLWTYRDICNKIIELEAEGFEIHCCMMDYLLKVPTTGCDTGPMGVDIRNMFERVRNFMTAKDILFITPHQLSPDAKMMVREGRLDFVKGLVGGGYYSGTKQLDQVVDGELFIHIEIVNDESYLTIQRGKHRGIDQTPIKDRFCVLKFNTPSGILDDLNLADSSRVKAGGGVIGSGAEIPFWTADSQI